jgi:hypothetical protein
MESGAAHATAFWTGELRWRGAARLGIHEDAQAAELHPAEDILLEPGLRLPPVEASSLLGPAGSGFDG